MALEQLAGPQFFRSHRNDPFTRHNISFHLHAPCRVFGSGVTHNHRWQWLWNNWRDRNFSDLIELTRLRGTIFLFIFMLPVVSLAQALPTITVGNGSGTIGGTAIFPIS